MPSQVVLSFKQKATCAINSFQTFGLVGSRKNKISTHRIVEVGKDTCGVEEAGKGEDFDLWDREGRGRL